MILGTCGMWLEYSIIPVSAKKFHFHRDNALVELKGPVKHDLIDI